MKRCVIVGAGAIENFKKIKSYFNSNDFFVVCDGGLNHINKLEVTPDLIIGDFDSFKGDIKYQLPIIKLPVEKDDTDTFAAVKYMIEKGFDDFLLVGVIGQRLDHTLGNISILMMLHKLNKNAVIIDDYSEISIISKSVVIIPKGNCSYFSIIGLNGSLKGVNIKGAKYPLNNAEIESSYQYAISNEIVKDFAEISIKEGTALLIKVF